MPSEIAVPFRLDGNGRVVSVADPDEQVRHHVKALINTHPDERAMVPGYGTDIQSLLFLDTEQDEVETQVVVRVRSAMKQHEPGVEILSARPEVLGEDESVARVGIEYRRLDAPDSSALANANVAVIGPNGVIREIVRG